VSPGPRTRKGAPRVGKGPKSGGNCRILRENRPEPLLRQLDRVTHLGTKRLKRGRGTKEKETEGRRRGKSKKTRRWKTALVYGE